MKRFLLAIMIFLLVPVLVYAAGTNDCSKFTNFGNGFGMFTCVWTGDASTGAVPTATLNIPTDAFLLPGSTSNGGDWIFQVVSVPGSPNPSASWSMSITDSLSGATLDSETGLSNSAASTPTNPNKQVLSNTFKFAVTQTNHGAEGTTYITIGGH